MPKPSQHAPRKAGDTNPDLFAGFGLAALFRCTPVEMAILGAVWYLHWRRSAEDDESRGMDALRALLCTPDPDEMEAAAEKQADKPADQAEPVKQRVSPRQLEIGVARLKRRGMLKTERTFGGKMAFYPTLPRMTFEQAEQLYKTALSAEMGASNPQDVRVKTADSAGPNVKDSERASEKREGSPPASGEDQGSKATLSNGQLQAMASQLLRIYADLWNATFKDPDGFVQHAGDRKAALNLLKQGVTIERAQSKAAWWISKGARGYARDNRCPFWLFAKDYNQIVPPAISPTAAPWDAGASPKPGRDAGPAVSGL